MARWSNDWDNWSLGDDAAPLPTQASSWQNLYTSPPQNPAEPLAVAPATAATEVAAETPAEYTWTGLLCWSDDRYYFLLSTLFCAFVAAFVVWDQEMRETPPGHSTHLAVNTARAHFNQRRGKRLLQVHSYGTPLDRPSAGSAQRARPAGPAPGRSVGWSAPV